MAARYADNSTDNISHGADPSLNNMPIGSLAAWVNFRDITNNFRFLGGKGVATQWFRRGVDATRVAFSHTTDATALSCDMETGHVHTGWNFLAYAWDFTNSVATYWGDLATEITEVSGPLSGVGSGSLDDDSGDNWTVGAGGLSTNLCAPVDVACFQLWDRVLTRGDFEDQRDFMRPTKGSLLYPHYGVFGGMGLQADLSGNGRHGVVTGATLAPHGPIRFEQRLSPEPTLPIQCLRPAADGQTHRWEDEGGATTNLFQSVDEVEPSDADYVTST